MNIVLIYLRARLVEKTTILAVAGMIATYFAADAALVDAIEALVSGVALLLLAVLPTPKMPSNKVNLPVAALAVAAFLLLTACAGAVPWNKQNFAGIVDIHTSYKCTEMTDGALMCSFKDQRIVDGKEQGVVDIKYVLADGTTLNYAADQVTAFQGQELRANVETAIAEQLGDVSPAVVDAVIKAIKGGTP